MIHLPQPFEKIATQLCADINVPRSLTVAILLRYKEYRQLFALKTDPGHYLTADDYFWATQATDLCRKLDAPELIDGIDREAECFERFTTTERQCHLTNLRMRRFTDGPLDPADLPLLPFLDSVRKIISDIVGGVPKDLQGAFGPGATLRNSSRRCTVPDKLQSSLCATASAKVLFQALYQKSAWYEQDTVANQGRDIEVVRGNRFFTVPKEATKLRGACLSPVLNGFLQKGVGSHLRRRLKLVGIKIDEDQPVSGLFTINGITTPDRHRRIAKQASLDEKFATIDLSDASNTISYELIRALFPDSWFALLDSLRERWVERPDGRWQKLEMFSAMGNGFTFEVETIVFYAIAQACVQGRGEVSVFGDDIIVPTEYACDVIAALRWAGFVPNQAKTFISGHFRESCGGDFFDGVPVRAHFVKKLPIQPADWIALANGLRRAADGRKDRWTRYFRAWRLCVQQLPISVRKCRGPSYLGDLAIHDEEDLWFQTTRVKHGCRELQVYSPVQRRVRLERFEPWVQFLSALYGVPSDGPIPRDAVSGYKLRWIQIGW